MNKRILDLAIKSGHIVSDLPLNANEKIQLAGLEKFAELIVRECAFYMYENYPHSRYEVNYMRRHMGDADWNKPIKDQLELNDERTN